MDAIRGFVTNLGKYNEGELVGKWVAFPIDEDKFEEVLKSIGVSDKPDEDGNYYEEYFFTDWESDVDGGLVSGLGEYESLESVNERAEAFADMDDDRLEGVAAFLEEGHELDDILAREVMSLGEHHSWSSLEEFVGQYYIDELGFENISEDARQTYFDYSSYGRTVRLEYYQEDEDSPETAGEYWCGDEHASDEEIGEAVVDQLGWEGVGEENMELYFDVEEFGRVIVLEGNFVESSSGKVFELV